MGSGHSHRAPVGIDQQVAVGSRARAVLLAVLAVAAVLTVAGLVRWWPDAGAGLAGADPDNPPQFAAPGVTFPTVEVVEAGQPCPAGGPDASDASDEGGQSAPAAPTETSGQCGTLRVDTGDDGEVDVQVPAEVLGTGIGAGDRVQLMRLPAADGGAPATYTFFTVDRDGSLLWLTLVFVGVVLAVARLRGVFALVGLAFGGAVVWWFVLPALLGGAPGVAVALTGATAIMFVVLYTTHGLSLRTSTALAGTLLGVLATALIGVVALDSTRLTGASEEPARFLKAFGADLDFTSLLGCALVIAGLGVLNDVTITQASAVWELRAASPTASRRSVFTSAMRIGRDHIASTIYTIVFAYVGTALLTLMLLQVYDRSLLDLLSTDELAEEVVRTLVTSIGLVLAVPLTTAIAAVVAAPASTAAATGTPSVEGP